MTHYDLVVNLATAKNTPHYEIPLGSVWAGQLSCNPSTQIADVLNIRPSYTQFCIDIFEVKVSRNDFLSDIKSDKWRGYLKFCNRFYFAVKKGIANKNEIPREAGLHTVKRAAVRKNEYDKDFLLSLIFYKKKILRNLKNRYLFQNYYTNSRKLLKKKGMDLSKMISFYNKHNQNNKRYF